MKERTRKFRPIFLMLPCVVFLLGIIVYPFAYNIYLSFFYYPFHMPWTRHFIGVGNYVQLFTDPYFLGSLKTSGILTGLSLTVETFLGLIIALLLNMEFKGRGVARMFFIIPLASIPIVNGYLFKLLLFPSASPITLLLMKIGLVNNSAFSWQAQTWSAIAAIVMADAWKWTPFMALIILAGLQAIPQAPYELANIDGASAWRVFWRITLPRLKFPLTIAMLIRAMDLLRVFDEVFSLTEGGPRSATETVAFYIYRRGFKTFMFGFASAASLIVWGIIFITCFLIIKKVFAEV